jgi:hypothetical protein
MSSATSTVNSRETFEIFPACARSRLLLLRVLPFPHQFWSGIGPICILQFAWGARLQRLYLVQVTRPMWAGSDSGLTAAYQPLLFNSPSAMLDYLSTHLLPTRY